MTPKQERFVQEYLIDLNATQAAIRAGYSEKTAEIIGFENLRKPNIAKLIEQSRSNLAKEAQIDAVQVLKQYQDIATCDPNEIVQARREACRYCWGKDHRYQFTQGEFEAYVENHRLQCEEAEKEKKDAQPFDPKGGTGFNPKRDPNPDCPECFGDGRLSVYIADTRKLSKQAKRLFAGIKQTREGIEVKLNDQTAALTNIGKHLGMFIERVEATGKNGGPIEITNLTDAALDARIKALEEKNNQEY